MSGKDIKIYCDSCGDEITYYIEEDDTIYVEPCCCNEGEDTLYTQYDVDFLNELHKEELKKKEAKINDQ